HAAGADDAEGTLERLAALCVENDVVVAEEVFEAIRLVVDDHIRAQCAYELRVPRPDGRGDGCAELLGELDGEGADASGTGVDEHFLARAQAGDLDKRLPGGESHERD